MDKSPERSPLKNETDVEREKEKNKNKNRNEDLLHKNK